MALYLKGKTKNQETSVRSFAIIASSSFLSLSSTGLLKLQLDWSNFIDIDENLIDLNKTWINSIHSFHKICRSCKICSLINQDLGIFLRNQGWHLFKLASSASLFFKLFFNLLISASEPSFSWDHFYRKGYTRLCTSWIIHNKSW